MKTLVLGVVALSFLVGCGNRSKNSDNDKAQSEINVVNEVKVNGFVGTYQGILPAADCEGIQTVLTLNTDGTYNLKRDYLGEEDALFETSGVYNKENDKLIELVTPSSGEKFYYVILDSDRVMLSDKEGTINKGELAEHYILRRVDK